jgi:WD40 repeat protein
VLAGHKDSIAALAFSPDGKALASAGADKSIRLWDVAAKQPRLALPAHTGAITSLAFSPDGQALASAGKDRFVRFWDPAEGRKRFEIEPDEDDDPDLLAISPDGTLLATTGHRDLTVKLFDATTGQPRKTLAGHVGRTAAVAFSPDSKILATSAGDGTARVWDVATYETKRVFRLHRPRGEISRLAYSPQGERLATVNGDGTTYLIDPDTPETAEEKAENEAGMRRRANRTGATSKPEAGEKKPEKGEGQPEKTEKNATKN